jgi:murein DD-endopeptidase MepM/ murein hydrolase activator NlpD
LNTPFLVYLSNCLPIPFFHIHALFTDNPACTSYNKNMTDPFPSISAFPTHRMAAPQAGSPEASKGTLDSTEFRDLITAMLLSLAMPGKSEAASGLGEMMAPLMIGLIEQLLAQQVAGQNEENQPAETNGFLGPHPSPTGLPLAGRLTQRFHTGHNGIDWGVPVGTPVQTTMDGKVVYAGWNNQGYGNLVIVENGPYRTYYAHLSEIPVQAGQSVRAGSVIGWSGNTGNSTGPHLHYEVRLNGAPIDPSTTYQ